MIWQIVISIISIYLILVLLVYFFQSKLLYFPDKNIIANPDYYGMNYEDVHFKTSDNVYLHGWYIPSNQAKYTLIFCHGNAGNISHRLESIKQFHELGLNIFIFDYRGYGKSEGNISEVGTYLDARAVWDYLINIKKVKPKNIIIFGRSLGAAIACHLAAQTNPTALIMESAFLSVPDLAAKIYPFLPVRWLSRFDYSNQNKIKEINCPVLFIHSRQDEIIPFSHGAKLFEVAKNPKQFLEIQGSHNDGFYISDLFYKGGVLKFLDSI